MGNNTHITMEYDGMEAAADKLQLGADDTSEALAKLSTAMEAVLNTLQGQTANQIRALWPMLMSNGQLISAEMGRMSGKMGLIKQYVENEDDHMAKVILQNSTEFDLPPDDVLDENLS